VFYSVAISTVFQAYLTTLLFEPGYEEPIRTIEEMLRSEKQFIFFEWDGSVLFSNTSHPVDSAIVQNAVRCKQEHTFFIWASVHHNISTVLKEFNVEYYRARGDWTDENNRPLLCEIESGVVGKMDFAIRVKKGTLYFEVIDDVLVHIVQGGIYMHIRERHFEKLKMESKLDVPTSADTYYAINILQTAFYLLMLGYLLAVACFVSEIFWHRYRSKGRGPTGTSLCHGQTKIDIAERRV
jgi:hypothetical protein